MNVRKNIDYSQMYQAIDDVMAGEMQQMQRYCAIGRIVCTRSEKGAAVMASEYIRAKHPEVQGFSPRNLRRMRDFYRTYENHSAALSLAMELGWTQNVVIMEADLTIELREWYLRATRQFGWSKTELTARIEGKAHMEIVLDTESECGDDRCTEEGSFRYSVQGAVTILVPHVTKRFLSLRCRGKPYPHLPPGDHIQINIDFSGRRKEF